MSIKKWDWPFKLIWLFYDDMEFNQLPFKNCNHNQAAEAFMRKRHRDYEGAWNVLFERRVLIAIFAILFNLKRGINIRIQISPTQRLIEQSISMESSLNIFSNKRKGSRPKLFLPKVSVYHSDPLLIRISIQKHRSFVKISDQRNEF